MLCTNPIGRTYKGYYIDFYKDDSGEFWFPMGQIMGMLNITDIDLEEVVDINDKSQYLIANIDGERIELLSIHGIDYFEKHENQEFPFFTWLRAEYCNMVNLFQWLKDSGDITTPNMLITEHCKMLLADIMGLKARDIWG